MKINHIIILLILLSIILNIFNYDYFITILGIVWYFASIFIVYAAIKYSVKYNFIQFKIKKIFNSLKSKSKNNISPLASLCISLAAKIGVGSLSGVALAIYYGGIGTIFWLCLISLLVSINAFMECILGIKYREKINHIFVGGPSYYIKKSLNNNTLSKLYGLLIIVTYSILFLSIQANTIVSTGAYFNINKNYIIVTLVIITLLIILKGLKGISKVNTYLVPIMLMIYFGLGIYIFIININIIPNIFYNVIKEAFNFRSIISVFLIGMQRAIFITESSIGTSAISASTCDNDSMKQGLLEVFGIYVTIFIVCITTFLIIVTSNYNQITFNHINGIEIVIYAFKYHFGNSGVMILSIITILFAFSTIISSYFFGESNLLLFSMKKLMNIIFKLVFILVIIISSYIKANILWNLTDYFVAILAIINVYAMLKINK